VKSHVKSQKRPELCLPGCLPACFACLVQRRNPKNAQEYDPHTKFNWLRCCGPRLVGMIRSSPFVAGRARCFDSSELPSCLVRFFARCRNARYSSVVLKLARLNVARQDLALEVVLVAVPQDGCFAVERGCAGVWISFNSPYPYSLVRLPRWCTHLFGSPSKL
jgi:hypothetical protein